MAFSVYHVDPQKAPRRPLKRLEEPRGAFFSCGVGPPQATGGPQEAPEASEKGKAKPQIFQCGSGIVTLHSKVKQRSEGLAGFLKLWVAKSLKLIAKIGDPCTAQG
jgi:hypothetical protein